MFGFQGGAWRLGFRGGCGRPVTGAPTAVGAHASFRLANELQKLRAGPAGAAGQCLTDRFPEIAAAAEQLVVEPFEFPPLLGGEAGPAQSNGVQPANRVIPARDCERGQIHADGGTALHQGQRADPSELMHQAIARNERPVVHSDVPAQQRAIGEDLMMMFLITS